MSAEELPPGVPTDEQLIEQAKLLYDGPDVDVDDGAKVSRGADDGAYVQAWVWVPWSAELIPPEPDGGKWADRDGDVWLPFGDHTWWLPPGEEPGPLPWEQMWGRYGPMTLEVSS